MTARFNKKTKKWFVDLRDGHGKRFRKKSPENSKAGAQAYEATLRHRLVRGEPIDGMSVVQQTHTFEQFAWKWFDEYVIPNNKFLEQRMKKYILGAELVPFFGKLPVEQITTQHIEQYKAYALKKGVKQKTVNNRLAVLGKCLRTAYDWLKINGTLPKIIPLKCPPLSTNHLSADECTLLLSKADGVIREVILTALRTGMRQGELRGLQWSSINWDNQIVTVRHSLCDRTKKLESPKSNRERHIPMDTDVYEMLFQRKKETGYVFLDVDGSPFDSQRLIRRLDEVRWKAGLRKFTWHTLRHTFASHLAMKGAPLHAVQALLGHSNISTTMRYAHVAPSALRSAIGLLNPKSALNADFGQPMGNAWQEMQQREMRNEIAIPEKALTYETKQPI